MKYELTEPQRRSLEAVTKYAKENELEIITRTIPFRNNDVPEFLKRLKAFEESAGRTKFTCRYSVAVKYA